MEEKIEILGVKLDNLTRTEILRKIRNFLAEPKFHQLATVNPEFILTAQENAEFKEILNSTSLNVADGFGINLAFWKKRKRLKTRLTGADLTREILKITDAKKMSVFLVCRKDGLSTYEEIREVLLKIYPDLKIAGVDVDAEVALANMPKQSFALHNDPNILFCNFGAPDQEIFINSLKCDTIRLAMGVGGSFDFLTGKVTRAPRFLRRVGLEWLWRVFQPQKWKFKKQRLRRIFRATIIFTFKILLNKK